MWALSIFSYLRWFITLAVSTGVLVGSALAFIDAARHSSAVYEREGKKSKKIWLIMLGVALAFALFGFLGASGVTLTILAIAPAAVYWYGVRPDIQFDTGNKSQPKETVANKFWSNYWNKV
ncbi:MAG: DUF2516 family protein [Cellulomonadaceae bacterium]|jgi:hypothetical protein|nr:DUF2516 family protein [Cellulomonadaceae bacterium]